MSLRDYSEVLDIGSIWQTRRRGSLNIVLYITNLDLSSDARKKHVPQVVFSDGQHVLSTSIDRFISRREYIRTDKDVANMLYDALAMPITLKEQSPSFLLDEEADVDDETGIYVGDDEDNYEGPQNFTYEDYYPQTPAAISAHQQDELEKEAETLQETDVPEEQEEASVSISASATEPTDEQEEECPVKLYVDDASVEPIIGYTQTFVDFGIIHEVCFSDKDSVSKIIDINAETYQLTLGSTSIEFMTQDIVNAYAGYDHGHIFYSVMFLESNEETEDEPMIDDTTNAQDSSLLVVDSEVPVNIIGSVVQSEEPVEEQLEDDQQPIDDQTLDLFEDGIYGNSEENQVEDEVQAQESGETPETTQEENQIDEIVNESSDEVIENQDDEELEDEELENETTDAVITEPMVSEEQEKTEVSAEEPELPQNPDSAIFVYNKQVEENNALADRLEAVINKEEEEENGSKPNTTTVEERSA